MFGATVEWQTQHNMKTGFTVVEMLIFIFICLLFAAPFSSFISVHHPFFMWFILHSLNTIEFTNSLRIHKVIVYNKQQNHSLNAFSHLILWAMSLSSCLLSSVFLFPSNLIQPILLYIFHLGWFIKCMVFRLTLHIPFAFRFIHLFSKATKRSFLAHSNQLFIIVIHSNQKPKQFWEKRIIFNIGFYSMRRARALNTVENKPIFSQIYLTWTQFTNYGS